MNLTFQKFRLSEDFKYETVLITETESVKEYLAEPYPVKGPPGGLGLFSSLSPSQWRVDNSEHIFADIHSSEISDSFQLLLHEPFEVPSEDSVKAQAPRYQVIKLLVTPEIKMIEDSMKELEPEE